MVEIKPFWEKILKKRWLIIVLGAILLLTAAIWGIRWLIVENTVVPEEMLRTSIDKTLTATAYRFHTKSTIILDGKTTIFSDLTGEKANEKRFHVQGDMLGTPINVFQVDNTTYRLDALSKKWIVIENNSIWKESMLMAELNPLSNFQFQELTSASNQGKEKINQRKTWKIQCVPKISNKWLDHYFKDLQYTIWVDRKDQLIRKAVITAVSKEKATGSLQVEVEFFDFGKQIEVQAPQ